MLLDTKDELLTPALVASRTKTSIHRVSAGEDPRSHDREPESPTASYDREPDWVTSTNA
jgi:hypothetical protein